MTITFFTRKNGSKKSLYARLTFQHQSTEIKLDFKPTEKTSRLDTYKRQVERDLMEIFNKQIVEKKAADPASVKAIYLSENKIRYLLQVYMDYINMKVKPRLTKGEITDRTLQKYEATYHHIADFLNCRSLNDINIRHVNAEFIDDFESYIRQFNAHNSTVRHLNYLKCIMTYAVNVKGYLLRNPFAGMSLKRKKTKTVFLEYNELLQLMDKRHLHERLEKIRDLFLFQCFTGLAYIDLRNLTQDKIHQEYIKINRKKNEEEAVIYLYEIPKLILEKYDNKLPMLSNAKFNAYLKELAVICNVHKKLTTHVARHTFATTVNLNNGVPLHIVSSLLGHSSIKMTEHYAKLKTNLVISECSTNNKKLTSQYNVEQLSMFFTKFSPQNHISLPQKLQNGEEKA